MRFVLDIPPVAKQRTVIGMSRHGNRLGHRVAMTPPKTRQFETVVRLAARGAMGGMPPIAGPVRLRVEIRMVKTRRFDLSNVVKAIEDGCNGAAYIDDKQICEILARVFDKQDRDQIAVEIDAIL